jgi:hypothetical protein
MNLKVESRKTEIMKRILFIALVAFIGFGSQQVLRAQAEAPGPAEKTRWDLYHLRRRSPGTDALFQ